MALGFIGKLKSTVVIAAVVSVAGFGAGWSVNGWRWEAKFAEMQTATIQVYEAKQKALNLEFAEQVERDTTARMALSRRLTESRSNVAGMERELETLRLSPTSPKIEAVLEIGDCDVKQAVVVANPFSDDFIRLWNTSAAGVIAGEPAPP